MATDSREIPIGLELQTHSSVSSVPVLPAVANDSGNLDWNGGNAEAEQRLPRADGGVAAWRILLAAFMFEAVLWGASPIDYWLHLHF